MLNVATLINKYAMQAHPEGGWYKETYRSAACISVDALPANFTGDRNISTGIYFLLEGEQFSAFHRIESDEMWHFYAGSTLKISVIEPNGNAYSILLGNATEKGETFQAVVPAGCWFASKPLHPNTFSFAGCTVAPGFDFEDFELADREQLISFYPQHADLIRQLTR